MGVNEIHQLLQRSNKGEICHNFIVDAQEDISKAIFFIRIMGFQRLLLFGFMYAMVMPSSSLKLLNLRRYRAEGTVGRFVVPREKLEVVIRDRINQDNQCGNCEYFYQNISLRKIHDYNNIKRYCDHYDHFYNIVVMSFASPPTIINVCGCFFLVHFNSCGYVSTQIPAGQALQ